MRAVALLLVLLLPAAAPAATHARRGATLPFLEYQAEAAKTDGTILGPSRAFGTLAAEASGREAVRLRAGGFVEFALRSRANAVDVRYSIPDSADGTGTTAALELQAGGAHLATLTLTSGYGWFYGGYPFTNRPRDGGAHHFYDDTRALLGVTLPAGTRVRLVATTATVIDLADFEQVARPLAQPAGSLAVTDFGADPSGARDSTSAFQAALDAGRAQRRAVWIPPGTFTVSRHLIVDDVTLEGAGPWYSVLHGDGVGVYGNPAPHPSTHVRLADFAIFGEVRDRVDSAQVNGVGGALGGGSVVTDLWIQHTKVGMWLDGPFDGLLVTGCRIQDTTADGINLHQGIGHAAVENTFVRNTGDDGLALWSDASRGAGPVHDVGFRFDTVQLPILANGIALYGGSDDVVSDDLVEDTLSEGGGIHVGNRFSSTPLGGTTTIARDTLVRSGSMNPGIETPIGALWFYGQDLPLTGRVAVTDTTIRDSSYAAIQFYGSSVSNVQLERVRIDGAGTFGLQVQANGGVSLADVRATRLGAAGVYLCAKANAFRIAGRGAGLRTRYCGPFPHPR